MLLARFGGSSGKLYVDDVFSAWVRTGTGADVTITTGIDMTKGYCLHSKGRSGATDHAAYHSSRGVTKDLATNTTAGETTQATGLKSVSSTGYTVGALAKMNNAGDTYVDWIFRNADKFYGHQVVIKSAGSNATVSFSNLGTLGRVRVKRTDAAGSWYEWHRSLSAGQLLIGESTAAAATLGHVTVSGTTVTLVNGVIADGSYLVEAWAHDTSPDGIIQCGSFITDALGGASVNIGAEAQFVIMRRPEIVDDWFIADTMRGWNLSHGQTLLQNKPSSESNGFAGYVFPTSTGFGVKTGAYGGGDFFIYTVIRRPNKPPTTGTQVYNAQTGSFTTGQVLSVGFPVDMCISGSRVYVGEPRLLNSRLTGVPSTDTNTGNLSLQTASVTAEVALYPYTYAWGSDGTVKAGAYLAGSSAIHHFFRRAPGVFDEICYNGSGSNKTEPHTLLGVPPELWRAKRRNGDGSWVYGSSLLAATEKIVCPSPNGRVTDATAWNSAFPTASQVSLGTHADVNAAGGTYLLEMWATLAGISKVGKYTGNGTSQNIECGFSAGARYVKIIRMTAGVAQDIYVWDTVRGIVAANDPHLSLNTTAAEVTTDDSLDPYAGGFAVNQNAATNINVNGAEYLFLAYA